MNIERNQIIAGMPALEARDWIRKCRSVDGLSIKDIAGIWKIPKLAAKGHIQAFEDEEYLEKSSGNKNQELWNSTKKGNCLALSSAGKRYTRATADRNYAQFIGRVHEINASDKYLFQVTKVAVFGSYLTDVPTVGDIDIFIWLEEKKKFLDGYQKLQEERTIQMQAEGRHFPSYGELLHWPELDVRKYLKNRSRVLRIQGANYAAEEFDYKVVYDINHQEES